jgi:hypothetical protein
MASYSSIAATDADADLTVDATARSLTLPSIFAAADRQTKGVTGGRVTIQVRTAPILYTLNGTDPTAATLGTGTELFPGDLMILTTFAEMDALSMIRATSTSGKVFYFFERRVN